MIKILLIFILLSVQPLFFISRLKQRFEVMLPVCCMTDILVILAFGMVFKNLTAGVIAVFVLAAASLVAAVYFERKNLAGFLSKVATPGFYAWCVGYCLMWAFSYKQFFMANDDFGFWGPFVKHMLYQNKLYTEPDIQVLVHKYYPPAVSLFEYLFVKIWGSNSDSVIFAAYKVLIFSGVLPFTKYFDKKENFKAVMLALTSYFFIMIWVALDMITYVVYVDAQLSVMFALYIYFAVFEKGNPLRMIICSITGVTLTLTKVTGFEFALVGMGVYAFIHFADLKKEIFTGFCLQAAIKKLWTVLLWALPLIAYFIWQLHTRLIEAEMPIIGSEGNSATGTVLQWLTLNGSEVKSNVLSAAIYIWFTTKMTSGWLPLYNPVLIIGFIFIMHFIKKSEKDHWLSNVYIILSVILPLGYLIYSLSLIVVQLNLNGLINHSGGWGMNSFNRYLVSYVVGMYLIPFAIIISKSSFSINKNSKSRTAILCVISMFTFILLPARVFQYLPPLGNDGYDATEYKKYARTLQKFDAFSSMIKEKIDTKIYFVQCDTQVTAQTGSTLINVHYWLLPINTNQKSFLEEDFQDGAEWGLFLLEGNFSHVLISDADNEFKNRFYKIFDCTYEEIKNDTLYEVVVNNDSDLPVKLVPIDVAVYSY